MTRSFPLAVILECTTGIALIQDNYDGLRELFAFITGSSREDVVGINLIAFNVDCKPEILRQHPKLALVNARGINETNVQQWLSRQVARFGKTLKISPLPSDACCATEAEYTA